MYETFWLSNFIQYGARASSTGILTIVKRGEVRSSELATPV